MREVAKPRRYRRTRYGSMRSGPPLREFAGCSRDNAPRIRLDRDVAQEKLDLVQLPSGLAAEPSARAAVRRSQILNGCSLGVVLFRHATRRAQLHPFPRSSLPWPGNGDVAMREPKGAHKPLFLFAKSLKDSRQVGVAHEPGIHGAGGFPSFGDGPYHQRLPAAHVAGGKYAGYGRHVVLVAFDVAALV
jgi:hypothetical protein